MDEMLTTGHARALLAITDPAEQVELATRVFDEKLSVRETEKLIKSMLEPAKNNEVKEDPAENAVYEQLENKMKDIVGTKVTINRKKNNKGKIEIEYYSQDELERIIDMFESIGIGENTYE